MAASYREFLIYKGSWKSDTAQVVRVPIVTESAVESNWISESTALTTYPDRFSYNLTLIYTSNVKYTNLDAWASVLDVSDGGKWYFADNKYIDFGSDGEEINYWINGSKWWGYDTARVKLFDSFDPTATVSHVSQMAGGSNSEWLFDKAVADVSYFYEDIEPYVADDDPYAAGGNSGEGGGTGTFSGTSDSIEFPGLPTLSATSTGFITLFNPTIAEMQSLATYMWSDVFDIGLYKTLFADPMDCILGCSIVPVAVPNGGTKTVNVGNVSTGISMTVAASQYVEVDCGTLNVEEFWGSYLDYDPYTKAEIYLPYCGTHALQVDDIMGKAVHVKYHVDILSGACCAYVKCGGSVMYSFVGQCSSSIPISANDWTNVVNGALTIAASVGSLIATGGASAPMAVGAAAAVTGTIYGGGIKQNVEKSGSMGGTGGMLAVQTPYLILTRPRQALPKKQNTYTGYPSFITTKLSDLKGYTEIDSIRITGVPATDAELNELESILKSGVIF